MSEGRSWIMILFSQVMNSVGQDFLHCTNASFCFPVDAATINSSSLSCKGVNSRPVLNLMWICPSGLNTGFTLQAKQSSDVVINGISAPCISNKEHQYNLSNVEFSTTYIVSITTKSCGLPSTPVSINCRSGIAGKWILSLCPCGSKILWSEVFPDSYRICIHLLFSLKTNFCHILLKSKIAGARNLKWYW